MSTHQDRLDRLEKKKQQLLAQIRDVKAKATKEARRNDTRRKILIGAMVIDQNDGSLEAIMPQLDAYLDRPHDRRLFGLPVEDPAESNEQKSDIEGEDV